MTKKINVFRETVFMELKNTDKIQGTELKEVGDLTFHIIERMSSAGFMKFM